MKRRAFLVSAGWGVAACDLRSVVAAIQGGFTGTPPERGHALRERWGQLASQLVTPGLTRSTRVIVAGGGIAGLAATRGLRVHAGCSVLRISEMRHGVEVDVLRHATNTLERWQAERCIVALPAFIAARVVASQPGFVTEAAGHLRYAAWAVANIHLREPLQDRPGPTVLTHYRALGDLPQGRQLLLQQPWSHWRDQTLADLARAHPDLPRKATRIDITRYGHGMSIPTPGTLCLLRKNDSYGKWDKQSLLLKTKQSKTHLLSTARLRFAHSDWSGYSIFEEAFTRGHFAGLARW